MAILDFLSPISIGASNSVKQKTSSNSTNPNSFIDTLHQAQSASENTTNDLNASSLVKSAINVGIGVSTGNILTSSTASLSLLEGLMNQAMSEQFTDLGANITTNFIAALSGDTSVTSQDITATATDALDSLTENIFPSLNEVISESTEIEDSATKSLSFIKGTIPWQLEQQRLKDLLEKRKS